MHTAANHDVDNRKYLSHQQRNAVAVALKTAPLLTPVEVRRGLKNLSPQKRIVPGRLSSVRHIVRNVRAELTSHEFEHCPVPVDGSLGSLTQLCQSIFLNDLIDVTFNICKECRCDL